MSSALLLPALAASSSGQGALYVDDVFSAYLRTGTGADTTVTTGIDMTKGYMLWSKGRSEATEHAVYDSARGVTLDLATNSIAAQTAQTTGLKAVSSTGHTIGSLAKINTSGATYVDWIFRKASKFFDVVTYTGNGVAGRQIAHSLGVQAGFVTVKATNTTGDWNSYHRSATGDIKLNLTDAQTASRAIITAADASTFTVSGAANTSGVSYVAYLFAHDPSADGIVQCGSFTTDGNGAFDVNLGWEPQWILIKNINVGAWATRDTMRGMSITSGAVNSNPHPALSANTSNSEIMGTGPFPTPTGFNNLDRNFGASVSSIYLAIRRPNKPPTSGAQVYNAVTKLSGYYPAMVYDSGLYGVDMAMALSRDGSFAYMTVDRLRSIGSSSSGSATYLQTSSAAAEVTNQYLYLDPKGLGVTTIWSPPEVLYNFRRATGFFDVVCDTGTGSAHAITHNLTKAPELIIRKSRSAATQWEVWHSALAATEKLVLNSDAAKTTDAAAWNSTLPTATQFTVGTGANVNANAATFVTYLFATLAGISKVGSYTGNGSGQTIDCGFSTGARFVLIKRTDAAGDWYVWDTARGIVAANDPHLSLNTTAAEVTTDDSIDPASVGFIVNQNAATNVNVTGANYIFLAIA